MTTKQQTIQDEDIQLVIVDQVETPPYVEGKGEPMRFFSKEPKGTYHYLIHHSMADKDTIYEYSLHRVQDKPFAISVVPCFDRKYVEHLQKGKQYTISVDNDVLSIKH